MRKKDLAILLTPAENHFVYIDHLINSIEKNTNLNFYVCILAPRDNLSISKTNNVIIKTVKEEDSKLFQSVYYSENKRSDIPAFVYSQLVAPLYFQEFQKLLFLEVDQIVRGDLASLWEQAYNEDIKLGAVQVLDQIPLHFSRDYPSYEYFNTGVVLYDTEYWKNIEGTSKCFEECKIQKNTNGERFRFYAQGAMNLALKGKFYKLESKYNVMNLGGDGAPQEEIEKGIILHWNGKKKPWSPKGAYKDLYYST